MEKNNARQIAKANLAILATCGADDSLLAMNDYSQGTGTPEAVMAIMLNQRVASQDLSSKENSGMMRDVMRHIKENNTRRTLIDKGIFKSEDVNLLLVRHGFIRVTEKGRKKAIHESFKGLQAKGIATYVQLGQEGTNDAVLFNVKKMADFVIALANYDKKMR